MYHSVLNEHVSSKSYLIVYLLWRFDDRMVSSVIRIDITVNIGSLPKWPDLQYHYQHCAHRII